MRTENMFNMAIIENAPHNFLESSFKNGISSKPFVYHIKKLGPKKLVCEESSNRKLS